MQLIVAEKPSVARDLARVLGVPARGKGSFEGPGHVITWCIGHLLELEEPAAYDGRWKVWRLETLPMLPAAFKLRPAKHARAQLRVALELLRDRRFTSVVNACDAGREGELIFRHLVERAGRTAPVRRLWISSLTDEAIRRGFATLRPGAELDALADAARARSEADWLVGMNATRAVTLGLRRAGGEQLLSIGRVQTPTLAMLVAREAAIRDFVPRAYWEVRASLAAAGPGPGTGASRFSARWCHGPVTELPSAALAGEVVTRCSAHGAAEDVRGPRVHGVESRVVREPPPLLFDLTSLQRTANRRFGFSAQRTLTLAQALYERHKVLTYPRTDSRHLSSDMVAELPAVLDALAELPVYAGFVATLGTAPLRPGRRVVDDAKVSDHHAIIPTARAGRGHGLDGDERRLFDLVARRFLGALFPDAEIALTDVLIRVGGPGQPPPRPREREREPGAAMLTGPLPAAPDWFTARGRVRLVAGWQEVAGIEPRQEADARRGGGDDDEAAVELPALQPGQALDGSFAPLAQKTQPPRRHTEATLLAAMETAGRALTDDALRAAMKDSGLGTPATRASIIETLLMRDYVRRDGKQLWPTATGSALIDSLPVPSLASAELTGRWEARLAGIARGQDSRDAFMRDIATWVRELVDLVRNTTPTAAQLAAAAANPSARPGRPGRGRAKPPGPRRPGGAPYPAAPARRPAAKVATPRSTAAPRARAAASSKPAVPVTALPCPRCKQGSLLTGKRGWGCARWREGCNFVIWFETAGRKLSEAQLRDLVLRGKTRPTRFVSPAGQPTQGRLVLDPSGDGGARLVTT